MKKIKCVDLFRTKLILDIFLMLGYYYLVDAGYTNDQGFLAPYRGTRYHLLEWRDGSIPVTPEEHFNMKHEPARNVIECCSGILKMRWAILRSPSFCPIKIQNRIIMAFLLIHNLIRREISVDPDETAYDLSPNNENIVEEDVIASFASSSQWTTWRDDLAKQMFDEWRGN